MQGGYISKIMMANVAYDLISGIQQSDRRNQDEKMAVLACNMFEEAKEPSWMRKMFSRVSMFQSYSDTFNREEVDLSKLCRISPDNPIFHEKCWRLIKWYWSNGVDIETLKFHPESTCLHAATAFSLSGVCFALFKTAVNILVTVGYN